MSRPRIRTLKPDTWADEKICAISEGAELLFVKLITFADDEGLMRDQPIAILGHCYPSGKITVDQLEERLRELLNVGLVRRYRCAGHSYLHVRRFARHQVINRPTASELPPPPDGNPPGAVRESSRKAPGGLTPGREGKGKERNHLPNPPPTSRQREPDIPGIPATPEHPLTGSLVGSPRQRGTNPRALGTNPRALGKAGAAAAVQRELDQAAAELQEPGIPDRVHWGTLRKALEAQPDRRSWEIFLMELELVAVRGGVLVLAAPATKRRWYEAGRVARVLIDTATGCGIPARMATTGELDALDRAGVPA